MKVYLLAQQFPFYEHQVKYPPDGVQYLPRQTRASNETMTAYYSSVMYQTKRKVASLLLNKFKVPVMVYKVHHHSDVIHSTRGILILNRMPWVMEIDYVGYFFGRNMFDKRVLKASHLKSIVSKILSSDNCKKIICWSNAAQRSLMSTFESDAKLDEKVEVVYPAIAAPTLTERGEREKEESPVRLLYVSSYYGPKGGGEVLSAFEKLLECFDDIELVFKCDVPDRVRAEHNRKEITYLPYRNHILPYDELIRLYVQSDVFVYPTHGDLFGLGLLDALASELPIVTTNTFAIPEIVEDGRTGLLVDLPYNWHDDDYLPVPEKDRPQWSQEARARFVDSLVEKLTTLIEDPSLRMRMGKQGRELIERGKFSLTTRNAALKRIYEEAVAR